MVERLAKERCTFDEADNIIFKVYESKVIKENYEELCNMPAEAFFKLYERVTLHEAFLTEAENEEYRKSRMTPRKR